MDNPPPDQTQLVTEIIDQRRPQTSWAKYAAFAAVGLTAIGCAAWIAYQFTPTQVAKTGARTIKECTEYGGKLLGEFWNFLGNEAKTTHTTAAVNRILSTDKHGPFVVAENRFSRQFTTTNSSRLFGSSTAEVRVSGTAFYVVPLLDPDAKWTIDVSFRDGVRACVIHAPSLRALTPVSVDTRTIEIKVETGWLRCNGPEMKTAALAEITPELTRETLMQMPSMRDPARRTIAAFVHKWLLSAGEWGDQKINSIQVLFPGESVTDIDFSIPDFHK